MFPFRLIYGWKVSKFYRGLIPLLVPSIFWVVLHDSAYESCNPIPPVPSHPKCHPSVVIPTMGPQATCLLAEISDNLNSLAAIPQSQDYVYTHVIIHSIRESFTLLFNTFIGTIRPMDDADCIVLQSTAKFTASQVANQFFALSVSSQINPNSVSDKSSAYVSTSNSANFARATSHSSHADQSYGHSSELDSSILPPYLESTALDSDETFLALVKPTKVSILFVMNFLQAFRCLRL